MRGRACIVTTSAWTNTLFTAFAPTYDPRFHRNVVIGRLRNSRHADGSFEIFLQRHAVDRQLIAIH